jgi:hypothetical protein
MADNRSYMPTILRARYHAHGVLGPPMGIRTWTLEAALLVVMLGIGLRLESAKMQADLWYDEAYSYTVAARPLREMLRLLYIGGDTNPPLYTLVLHLWLKFGSTDAWVKGLSLALGVAATMALYALGRRIGGVVVGLISAALFAVSPWAVYYSIEARPYALFFVLSLASTHAYLDVLSRRPRAGTRPATVYVTLTALAIATHWFGLLLPVIHVVGLWIYGAPKDVRRTYWRSCVFIGVVTSPLALLLRNQLHIQASAGGFSWPGPPDAKYVLEFAEYVAGGRGYLTIGAAVILGAALLTRASTPPAIARPSTVSTDHQHALFLIAYLLLPLSIAYVASIVHPEFSVFVFRYLLPFAIASFILIGIAVTKYPLWVAVTVVGVLLGLPAYRQLGDDNEPTTPYSRVVHYSWSRLDGHATLRLHLSPMSYHSVRRYRPPDSVLLDRILWSSDLGMGYVLHYNVRGEMVPRAHMVDLKHGLGRHDDFWVVVDQTYPSRRAIILWKALRESADFERTSIEHFGAVHLERYRRIQPFRAIVPSHRQQLSQGG